MSLLRLSENCQKCPFVEECDRKQMEALGRCFSEPKMSMEAGQSANMTTAQPLLRETATIYMDGKPITVYTDETKKQLYDDLYSHLGLHYGG